MLLNTCDHIFDYIHGSCPNGGSFLQNLTLEYNAHRNDSPRTKRNLYNHVLSLIKKLDRNSCQRTTHLCRSIVFVLKNASDLAKCRNWSPAGFDLTRARHAVTFALYLHEIFDCLYTLTFLCHRRHKPQSCIGDRAFSDSPNISRCLDHDAN